MKLLDVPEFGVFNAMLNIQHQDSHIEGRIEAFSCKMIRSDKALYASLSKSPDPSILSISPFGTMTDTESNKTISYLISTLNLSFGTDYDFTEAEARHFERLSSLDMVRNSIDSTLRESFASEGKEEGPAHLDIDGMWAAIDKQILLRECDVYRYAPDEDGNPFQGEGYIWSFNYFFFNKRFKQIVFFTCSAYSDIHSPVMRAGLETNGMGDEEFDLAAEEGSAAATQQFGMFEPDPDPMDQ